MVEKSFGVTFFTLKKMLSVELVRDTHSSVEGQPGELCCCYFVCGSVDVTYLRLCRGFWFRIARKVCWLVLGHSCIFGILQLTYYVLGHAKYFSDILHYIVVLVLRSMPTIVRRSQGYQVLTGALPSYNMYRPNHFPILLLC